MAVGPYNVPMLFRIAALLLVALSLGACVTRITVERRESPAYGARSFGKVGQYETLAGHFYCELDPKDPRNAIVNDIQLAPRNARGMVEYSATFTLAKPIDMSKASGVLYYLVPNRGNGAPAASETGDVSLVSGWQGDLLPRPNAQTITVPVAKNRDGSPITGPVIERLIDLPPNTNTVDLGTTAYVGLTYPRSLTLDTAKGSLTRRTAPAASPMRIPPADWAFADCTITFSGHARAREDLRQKRLLSGVGIPAPIHRQGPAGFGYRLCCNARRELLPPLCGPGRRRHAQSRRQGHQVDHEPRRLAIRKLYWQLHPPRL